MNIEKPGYWAVIPATVRYDETLPANAKLLYAEISSLTDQAGYCFASNQYFANLYNLSQETVIRLLRTLESRGYIRREDNDGGKSQRKIYAGVNPVMSAAAYPLSKMTPPPVKNDTTPLSKMTPISRKINNKSNNTPQSPPRGPVWDPEMFDRFWSRYPKKKDKAKAIAEWDKLKADRKLMMEMSAALGAQMASDEWQRDNGRAIPYPCRWLSHRRWEDEITLPAPCPRKEDDVWL